MKKWATPGHLGVTLSSNGLTNCLWVAHIAGTWSAEMGVLLDSITEVWFKKDSLDGRIVLEGLLSLGVIAYRGEKNGFKTGTANAIAHNIVLEVKNGRACASGTLILSVPGLADNIADVSLNECIDL